MSRLLSRAKVNLYDAQINYGRISLDDAYLDMCCNNLQQSIELSLKFIVEMNGEQYAENHDIRANLNKLNILKVELPCTEELRRLASTLYSWETESRYRESFIAAIEDVEEAFQCARTLAAYAESLVVIMINVGEREQKEDRQGR